MNTFAHKPTWQIGTRHALICVSLVMMTGCPPNNPPDGPANNPPTVIAGENQVVTAGDSVTLDGSASSDPDGDAISFSWKQTLGTPVSLSGTSTAVATFTAPASGTTLGFELTVGDGKSNSVGKVGVAVRMSDPLGQIEERRQRSVTDDPNVLGNFPPDWLIPDAGAGLPPPPTQEDPVTGSEPELPEFVVLFKGLKVAEVVQEDLAPGVTRTVTLDIDAPSGLAGLAQWIGTTSPLDVNIALDGTVLATGSPYSMGHDRGGSYLNAVTTAGGQASFSVTNTSDVTVLVRMSFMGRDMGIAVELEPE
jgi:hypothetical protein